MRSLERTLTAQAGHGDLDDHLVTLGDLRRWPVFYDNIELAFQDNSPHG